MAGREITDEDQSPGELPAQEPRDDLRRPNDSEPGGIPDGIPDDWPTGIPPNLMPDETALR